MFVRESPLPIPLKITCIPYPVCVVSACVFINVCEHVPLTLEWSSTSNISTITIQCDNTGN